MLIDPFLILQNKFSIFHNGHELIKDLVLTGIEANSFPPCYNIVHSFTAEVLHDSLDTFYNAIHNGLVNSFQDYRVIYNGVEYIVYIDSYERHTPNIEYVTDISGHTSSFTSLASHAVIRGHFDGRDLEGTLKIEKRTVKKEESIRSRFEILDL